ncbi:MAG: helix-turn-helix domain-containing protein [Desulfurococcales archaeon]|nr:helix-turn-helix domain-containing protein [Desulfurococcales archaeon]MCE4605437.1 helix-turn-helix domain-containing protein [Desulfurococcales archaeon]
MARFLHNLSKDARRRIIEVMLSSRSQRSLAEELGITPAAVNKYLTGKTHPSDRVMERILEIASGEEVLEISKIIAEDLAKSMEEYLSWAADRRSLHPASVKALEQAVNRARLLSLAGRMTIT